MVLAVSLLGRVDVAKISPSVGKAGDDPLPMAQHQGGWIMRRLGVVAEVVFARIGVGGTYVRRAGERSSFGTPG